MRQDLDWKKDGVVQRGVFNDWCGLSILAHNGTRQSSWHCDMQVTAHALFQASLIAILLTFVMFVRKRLSDTRKILENKRLYGGAVLTFACAVGFQSAVKYLDVSLLEAIKRCIGLFSAVVAGYFSFRIKCTLRKLASAVCLQLGFALFFSVDKKSLF